MLKQFNSLIKDILIENNAYKFNYADDILEYAFDKNPNGFKTFDNLKKNSEFIEKLNNSDKNVLEDAADSLWTDNIEKYDDDQKEVKQEVIKFYNYLKELILKKE